MNIKPIDLISLMLGLVSWILLDISLLNKVWITGLFVVLIIFARIQQRIIEEIDLLNFSVGAFAWLLPDINVVSKVLICLVLIGIAVLAHKGTLKRQFKESRFLKLLVTSMIISYFEFWLVTLLFPHPPMVHDSTSLVSLTTVFAITIGLPLELYGVLSKGLKLSFTIMSGCLWHLFMFAVSIFLFSSYWVKLPFIDSELADMLGLGIWGPTGFLLDNRELGFVLAIGIDIFMVLQYVGIGKFVAESRWR